MTNYAYKFDAAGLEKSTNIIVPIIMKYFKPKSILDINYGKGSLLNNFSKSGIEDLLGFDFLDKSSFSDNSVDINRKFDVVSSPGLSNYITDEISDIYIDNLTAISDVIIFSETVNNSLENPQSYWQKKFNERDYFRFDIDLNFHSKNKPDNEELIFIYINKTSKYSYLLSFTSKELKKHTSGKKTLKKERNSELFYINPDVNIKKISDIHYKIIFNRTKKAVNIHKPRTIKFINILLSKGGVTFNNSFTSFSTIEYLLKKDIIRKVTNPYSKVVKNPNCISKISSKGKIVINYFTEKHYQLDIIEEIIWNNITVGKNMMFIIGESCFEKTKVTIPCLLDSMENMIKNNLLQTIEYDNKKLFDLSDVNINDVFVKKNDEISLFQKVNSK